MIITPLRVILVVLILSMCGCAAQQPYQAHPAISAGHDYAIGPSVQLDRNSNTTTYLNDRSTIYSQNFGGSVALGVFLGPIGVLINHNLVDTRTTNDMKALVSTFDFDALAMFKQAIDPEQVTFHYDTTGRVNITPYLYVTKVDKHSIAIAAALLVDLAPIGIDWIGKYMYQLPQVYAYKELARGLDAPQKQQLADAITDSFRQVWGLYHDDRSANLGSAEPLMYKSPFLTPRFTYQMQVEHFPRYADRTVFRTSTGMYSLPKAVTRSPGDVQLVQEQRRSLFFK